MYNTSLVCNLCVIDFLHNPINVYIIYCTSSYIKYPLELAKARTSSLFNKI